MYIDEVVVLVLAFHLDDNKQSWEKACGNKDLRAYIYNAPSFVMFNDNSRKITIRPQNKVDQGNHKMLIQHVIEAQKFLHAVFILVKLPISYIDSNLKPYFLPALADETK